MMRIRPGIELAALSDVGCHRENNEDRYSYWEPADDAQFQLKGRLAIVADGMGGYEGGQEASRLAVETIEEVYADTADSEPQALLLSAFQAAHDRIQQQATERSALHGMGTTCTAIALLGHHLYFAHVGDSRLYLVRDGSISRLTHDHSYVSRLVEHGVISSEEAESHPQRHILTAALGAGSDLTPEMPEQPVALSPGDVLVLCTDGLWGVVHDDEIRSVVSARNPHEACHELVHTAKQRGGPDNITMQVLRVAADGRPDGR
ncbi:MAG TPA: Stp1/IreP family PP2C-type Ser/Thr phosphatase [Terriglobales bacterium]|nr:Stp1/IreP family PP2C-type Ser/Thr phosphatase [Terriglobales bacterium]